MSCSTAGQYPDPALRIRPGYYSKSAPATILNSFHIINSASQYYFYSTLIRKARGQATVAATVPAIMTFHCSSRWKSVGKAFHPGESRILPDFPQHPMLLSAYIRELSPQSSAGSKLLPQQQKSFREVLFTAEIPSLSQVLGIVS